MFATRELKRQNRDFAPLSKKQTSQDKVDGARQPANLPGSAEFLQRYLGNNTMQSFAGGQQSSRQETAPGPGPTPTPPTPAPAPAQRVTDITVANQSAAITYKESSSLGAGGRKHFVTVAGRGPDVIVEATLTPAGIPSAGSVTWTGATPNPGNPARATISRARSGKHEVTATAGVASASLTVWAVFVSISSPAVTLSAAPTGTAPYYRNATKNFTGTIHPAAIINDPDHPELEGVNTVNPAGNNYCGVALSGGVDHKWDMSRKLNQQVTNPNRVVPPVGPPAGPPCFWTNVAFPGRDAEGNDDTVTTDENNNPYAGGEIITSNDIPGQAIPDGLGNNGDTLVFGLRFREFARLEYHRTWWRVSHLFSWRVTFRARKTGGRWVDNGSTASP